MTSTLGFNSKPPINIVAGVALWPVTGPRYEEIPLPRE
jgi:hypothetical protein